MKFLNQEEYKAYRQKLKDQGYNRTSRFIENISSGPFFNGNPKKYITPDPVILSFLKGFNG